jgi:hypothetical protein
MRDAESINTILQELIERVSAEADRTPEPHRARLRFALIDAVNKRRQLTDGEVVVFDSAYPLGTGGEA